MAAHLMPPVHAMPHKIIRQRWTTSTAIAEWMGTHSTTVARWCSRGWLKASLVQAAHYTDDRPRKTPRGVWRIYEPDLVAFLARLRSGSLPTRELRWRR